ncbi:MAG TPA: hypothetical protein VL400_12980, partial [Polyangiaceae bacterium]|nr:hypothetical protein [Polyangiaceae bacterium]
MNFIRRAAGGVSLVLVGCSGEVIDPAGSGGGASASSTGGGGPSTPHDVEIAARFHPLADRTRLLVLVNHPDGSLVTTAQGADLPIHATMSDGDLVSYAYVSWASDVDGQIQRVSSYRVTPETRRIEHAAELFIEPDACVRETMHLVVHVPEAASA